MLDSASAGDIAAVRDHTQELIEQAPNADEPVLIEAPPNAGKTTSAIKLAQKAEKPVTYLARRIDLYEQAEKKAEKYDLRFERIPAPQRDCKTFTGENSGDSGAVKQLYNKGYSGFKIHLDFRDLTPCGMDCNYIQKLETIDKEIDDIDLLIGHHSHSKRQQYIKDRIVIIDEFNPDPFLHTFPDDSSGVIDEPGKIIPRFLKALETATEDFPIEVYRDVTDLVQQRDRGEDWQEAIDWFRDQDRGASRYAAGNLDFFDPTLEKYDDVNAYAPLLTFSLLCMERIGPGIELAPPPDGALDEIWKDANLGPATKCLRNRNTGKMYALQSPDLSAAEQIIGLDGTPTIELWNLLYAPKDGFDHQQIISRTDFSKYLSSAMNLSVIQIGNGMHPYAAGNISDLDSDRFTAIQALEEDRFALISTKQALKRYQSKGLLKNFVKKVKTELDNDDNRVSTAHQALHYAMIKSSNEFKEEPLGVVTGMPHPGYDVVQLWAGFCGEAVEFNDIGDADVEESLSELGERIQEHFVHNQVVQAVLRYGRDESVYENEGTTVYVSTHALPDWFNTDTEYTVQSIKLEGAVLAKLFETYQTEDKHSLALQTVDQIYNAIDSDNRFGDDHSKQGVRLVLKRLESKQYVRHEPDRGKHSADLYSWNGDGEILQTGENGLLLCIQDDIHIIQTKSN